MVLAKLKAAEVRAVTRIAAKFRGRMSMRIAEEKKMRRNSSEGHWDNRKKQMLAIHEVEKTARNTFRHKVASRGNGMSPDGSPMAGQPRRLTEQAARNCAGAGGSRAGSRRVSDAEIREPAAGSEEIWKGYYVIGACTARVTVWETPTGLLHVQINYVASKVMRNLLLTYKDLRHFSEKRVGEMDAEGKRRLAEKVCTELTEVDSPTPEMLQRVPNLRPLTDAARHDLAKRLRLRKFPADRLVMRQHERGDCMFFVKSGDLRVNVNGRQVHSLGASDFFGEIALMSRDCERTATVQTVTRCELYKLSREDFVEVMMLHPGMDKMMADAGADYTMWDKVRKKFQDRRGKQKWDQFARVAGDVQDAEEHRYIEQG
eukprot:g2998.t1